MAILHPSGQQCVDVIFTNDGEEEERHDETMESTPSHDNTRTEDEIEIEDDTAYDVRNLMLGNERLTLGQPLDVLRDSLPGMEYALHLLLHVLPRALLIYGAPVMGKKALVRTTAWYPWMPGSLHTARWVSRGPVCDRLCLSRATYFVVL